MFMLPLTGNTLEKLHQLLHSGSKLLGIYNECLRTHDLVKYTLVQK